MVALSGTGARLDLLCTSQTSELPTEFKRKVAVILSTIRRHRRASTKSATQSATDLSPNQDEPTTRTRSAEAAAWAIEQYKSLRQESIQSEAALHTSMQWGMAATVAALVGTMAISAGANGSAYEAQVVQLVALGLMLPWLLFAMSLVWLGEVRRLARAGLYLRWLEDWVERRLSSLPSTSYTDLPSDILSWENYLSGKFPKVKQAGRNWEGYLGNMFIFCGGQLASVILWQSIENKAGIGRQFAGAYFLVLQGAAWGQLAVMWVIILLIAKRRVLSLG